MLIEFIEPYAYYLLMFTLYGIGLGISLFFKELDLVTNLKASSSMEVQGVNYISPLDKVKLGLIDVMHHWWLGLLLASVTAVFKPFPMDVLNDAVFTFGLGQATPDVARGIKRFYYNLRKIVDFSKMPTVPPWLASLIISILPPKVADVAEAVAEKLKVKEETKEELEKRIEDLVSKALDQLIGGGDK